MTLEEALQEIQRLRWILSVRLDETTDGWTLLDTYDQTNPAWIDAMMHGTYGPMPERLKPPPPILGMRHIAASPSPSKGETQ